MDIPVRPKAVGLNLTPLIDIVFLLLVFFLLTTHFIEEEGIGVRLPSAASRVTHDPEEGAVAEKGTHEELLRQGGIYSEIHHLQQISDELDRM